MQIETIFKKLGKQRTLNFIRSRGICSKVRNDKPIYFNIYILDQWDCTDYVIKDYLELRNHQDFNRWVE